MSKSEPSFAYLCFLPAMTASFVSLVLLVAFWPLGIAACAGTGWLFGKGWQLYRSRAKRR